MNTKTTKDFLIDNFKIDENVIDFVKECEDELKYQFDELDEITEYNQLKVLNAFQKNRISDNHFNWNTGYGYDDIGRDAVERVYADIFHTESALVRTQMVNGTHALAVTLFGILRPGDEMIYCTGGPYDTLEEVIGIRGSGMGSLIEYGIKYKQVELCVDNKIDMKTLRSSITDKTKLVCKAYSSAVGAGAFVSEIFGDEADELRRRGGDGGEFGVTTGRPRRVGWFDAVATRYGCMMQGTTEVSLTVLDPLGYLDEIPVCVGYEIDGVKHDDFPNTTDLNRAKPILKTLPGWKCDITGIRCFEDLPKAAQNYVNELEVLIGYPITIVTNGPNRNDFIKRRPNI